MVIPGARIASETGPDTGIFEGSRYFDVEYHINSRGFRDAPRTERRAVRPYRVVLYGDSMVFGQGVELEEAFASRLERGLLAQGRPAEVINVSRIGSGP